MKKLFLSLACVASFCACQAQHQLTVNFSNLKSDTIVFQVITNDFRAVEKSDTVLAKNGTVVYDVDGDKARLVNFFYKTNARPSRMQVYVVPGEQGVLNMTEDGGKWSGSAFYSELAAYENVTDPMEAKLTKLTADFSDQVRKGANADSLRNIIMPEYQKLSKEIEDYQAKFIAENPNSNVSATLLLNALTEENIAKLGNEVKNGKFSNFINYAQAQIDRQKAMDEAKKKVAEGNPAPEFTLKDINGKDLALSSLRGKYVVLDFWGSWCGWCIKGFPEMKKYYEKYAGKFEILGIDCNDTEDKWKKSVADNNLPWKHVYNPRTGDITTKYAVTGFPTKIIVDPEGKIYKTIVGESPEFYTILDNLFGK